MPTPHKNEPEHKAPPKHGKEPEDKEPKQEEPEPDDNKEGPPRKIASDTHPPMKHEIPDFKQKLHDALAGQILFEDQQARLDELAENPPKTAEEFRQAFNAIVQPGTLQAAQQQNIEQLINEMPKGSGDDGKKDGQKHA